MPVPVDQLPRYLVVDPKSGLRIAFSIRQPACEIDVTFERRSPGESVVLFLGHPDGRFVQRARIAGRAEFYFEPERRGDYVLVVVNPMGRPAVVHLEGRDVPELKWMRRARARSGGSRVAEPLRAVPVLADPNATEPGPRGGTSRRGSAGRRRTPSHRRSPRRRTAR